MLTIVNRNPTLKLAVIKRHYDGQVFEYQVHNEAKPLDPIVTRFPTKKEADNFISYTPVAPVRETRAMKSYPKFEPVRQGKK